MNTRPVTNLKSLRSNVGGQFAVAIRESGMVVPKGISMGAFALLREMAAQDGIMPAATTTCAARAGAVCQPAKAMGIVIKAGWAGYVAPMKHYRLTPTGHAVLREATEKGLMATLRELEERLEEAARAHAKA
jgi:hypothetical protein